MEPIFLTCMVIAYFLTKGKVDGKAYENGKEPPGVAKARMRHDAGGGSRSASGRPKGKGAFRLMLADRWANACESARQRGEHKARRRRAWYDETAPHRDASWRDKQLAKLEKKNTARSGWARNRGLIDLGERRNLKAEEEAWAENERRDAEAAASLAAAAAAAAKEASAGSSGEPASSSDPDGDTEPDKPEPAVTEFPLCTDPDDRFGGTVPLSKTHAELIDGEMPCWWEGGPAPGRRPTSPCPEPRVPGYPFCRQHIAEHNQMAAARDDASSVEEMVNRVAAICGAPDPEAATGPADNPEAPATPEAPVPTATEGTSTVYEQAVIRLIAAADQVAEYRADLSAFADTLDGKRWGVEVTGPIKDMDGQLVALEGDYRDLAGQMKVQGDAGVEAHEQAPWVPADDSILV